MHGLGMEMSIIAWIRNGNKHGLGWKCAWVRDRDVHGLGMEICMD